MDLMFSKYKNEFIAAINATLDMMYNSIDTLDLKKSHGETINIEEYNSIKNNANILERVLADYKNTGEIKSEDEKYVVAALGTTVIHMEYLADSYKEAARQAKIIIANIKSKKQ